MLVVLVVLVVFRWVIMVLGDTMAAGTHSAPTYLKGVVGVPATYVSAVKHLKTGSLWLAVVAVQALALLVAQGVASTVERVYLAGEESAGEQEHKAVPVQAH